ncbi:MAG TPA: TMEM165/GDT1 family protein [Steroidobacteraceae bacterium]|jgi:putative Ca2+/H+ antiporter (TMEM165/GDT1 family)|nr:TMEM165/GDT1 family protein [Steroidobacteraceae bacterium]
MEAFLVSTGIVALSEMGDKTQLLALLLATQFRRPLPIVAGIFVATVINHLGAGAIGGWLTHVIGTNGLRWILGLSFLGMAVWMLIPDKLDDTSPSTSRYGVFMTTAITFFLAEMGDKTQIATVALAARFNDLFAVVAGTTLGMMIADVPAVWFGEWIMKRVPVRKIHIIAAIIFAILGVLTLLNVGAFL